MAHYIYYPMRRVRDNELVMLIRAYRDGDAGDFLCIEKAYQARHGEIVTISATAMNWAEADSLVAMGIEIYNYRKNA